MKKYIMFLIVLFVVGMVSAISMPHAFYGEVYYSDGVLVQDGLTITANIDGIDETSPVVGGLYDLVVESEDEEIIYFYINGLTEAIGSYTFDSFAVTELDFTTGLSNPNSEDSDEEDDGGSSSGGTSRSGRSSSSSNIVYGEYDGETSLKLNQKTQEISTGITGSVIGVSNFNKILGISGVGLILVLLILILVAKSRE